MGHQVQAIIGRRSVLEAHAEDFPSIQIVLLPFKQALIPLTDELLDEIGDTAPYGGFFKLTTAVVSWLQRLSSPHPWSTSKPTTSEVAAIKAPRYGAMAWRSCHRFTRKMPSIGP